MEEAARGLADPTAQLGGDNRLRLSTCLRGTLTA